MKRFRRIGVYCSASDAVDAKYFEAARSVGRLLGEQGIGVVFGGGRVGLMGAVADAALGAGGEVVGVIPKLLFEKEIAHTGLSELILVDGMHSRKMIMHSLADAFIGLPGGWGTMDELLEVSTWNQIGYHRKPVGLLNTNRYFDKLLDFFDQMVSERFLAPEHRVTVVSADKPEALLETLESFH